MMTIYIHRKKVADIICMVYLLAYPALERLFEQNLRNTYDSRWTFGGFGLILLCLVALYILSRICDWKMAAINLLVYVIGTYFMQWQGNVWYCFTQPSFTTIVFLLIILCHQGYLARKKAKTASETDREVA